MSAVRLASQPEFDLRAVVAAALAESPSADPHVVAGQVRRALPPEHRDEALEQALPAFVRVVANGQRSSSISPVPSPTNRSSRWDAVKWSLRVLAQRVEIGDEDREWKFMRDCTRDDLLRAAGKRRTLAAQNLAKADEFEAVAEKMRVHRAATVADLSAELLAEALR